VTTAMEGSKESKL